MKLLIFTNSLDGLISFRIEVIHALISKGYVVFISAPNTNKKVELTKIGCKFIPTEFNRQGTNPIKDFQLITKYIRIVKDIKPNVILSYTIKPNVYGGIASRITGIPIIANITGLGTAVENGGLLQKLTFNLYRLGLKKAKCIFFQNVYNKNFFEKHIFKPKHSVLIPGSGVNLQKHIFKAYPQEGDLQFVFIGRILKQKGIEEYLYVAKEIKNEYPQAIFHILGSFDDNSYKTFINDYHEKGIINYHGSQDVRPFLEKCCCTIHPSYYPEGMSNVLLESQATGRPVITTDRVGCADAVEKDVTGFIVKQRDKEKLLTAVKKFIALDYSAKKQMGENARKRMEQYFDRQIVIDAYLKEIEN